MNIPTKFHLKSIGNYTQRIAVATALLACFTVNTATAFEDLNEPQNLIYDTSHLGKTKAGSTLSYSYTHVDKTSDINVEDQILLSITKEREDAHRDVSVNFLSEERKMFLPNFDNRRGNPVIIGMLEHLAQAMGDESGGGTLYFRNRIRDKLADDNLEVVKADGKMQFSFAPLENDPYVAEKITLRESVITIAFSDDVPGQLLSIEYVSGPSKDPAAKRTLEFSGVQPE